MSWYRGKSQRGSSSNPVSDSASTLSSTPLGGTLPAGSLSASPPMPPDLLRPSSRAASRRGVAVSTSTGSPLVSAECFNIPVQLLQKTLDVVRSAGRDGSEAFVVWGGRVSDDGNTVSFTSCLAPRQTAHKTPRGLLVTVDGEALFELNRELYKRGELLAAQVHSHPHDAYHSETDDCFSLVTLTGALSIVIPRFGTNGLDNFKGWAWYRMTGQSNWSPLGPDDKIQIIHEGAS